MGGRPGGSADPGQVQGQPVSALHHRRVFEIRVGGTPQVQDGRGRDPSLRKGAEKRPGSNPPQASNGRRQIILQQDLPSPDDAPRHSPLFHGWGHENQHGGTFQSHLEATPLSVFYRQEHVVVHSRLAQDRAGVQSIPSPKHRDAPRDVDKDNVEDVWQRLYTKRGKPKRPALKVGDRVRLNKKHRTFKKSYLPGWTEEVFVVTRARRGPVPTYKIAEWDDAPVRGTFYAHDLQKVGVGDDDLFRVDRIVKRRKDKVLVHWKRWPDKYDSWVKKGNVTTAA